MKRENNDRGNRGGFNSRNDGGGFNRGGFNQGPREMHKATCAECKQECEVPFKPREDRPVYCRDCFQKNKH
ncbi:DNA-directed RNA polymerase [archaeon]|nr:DNA-directed RNA polymerase [archaeon]MBL7056899.1 DNA-directed RNA polymerase [Candidatus Woesearchaeota archaeon]